MFVCVRSSCFLCRAHRVFFTFSKQSIAPGIPILCEMNQKKSKNYKKTRTHNSDSNKRKRRSSNAIQRPSAKRQQGHVEHREFSSYEGFFVNICAKEWYRPWTLPRYSKESCDNSASTGPGMQIRSDSLLNIKCKFHLQANIQAFKGTTERQMFRLIFPEIAQTKFSLHKKSLTNRYGRRREKWRETFWIFLSIFKNQSSA